MKEDTYLSNCSQEYTSYFKSVLEVSPMGIIFLDFDGQTMCWSKAAENLFGWKAEKVIGKFHPGLAHMTKQAFLTHIRKFADKNVNYLYGEAYHITREGKLINLGVTTTKLINSKGKPIGVIGMHEDITQKVQYKNSLLNSVYGYRRLLEAIKDGFVIFDSNFMINYVNKSFAKMLGYSTGELFATNITDYMLDPCAFIDAVNYSANLNELGWLDKKGKKVHTLVSPGTKSCIQGSRVIKSMIVTDISEIRESQNQLNLIEKELLAHKKNLEEVNIALEILLEKRDNDKKNIEENMVASVNNMVLPLVSKLRNNLNDENRVLLNRLQNNLNDITSPFCKNFTNFNFTSTELQVATFIKQGMQTKEIAETMCLSAKTIDDHRKHIRKKLGISGEKKANLRLKLLLMDKE